MSKETTFLAVVLSIIRISVFSSLDSTPKQTNFKVGIQVQYERRLIRSMSFDHL